MAKQIIDIGSGKSFTMPEFAPYSDYFKRISAGGWSTSIAGSPQLFPGSTLNNCVGWANGRFNQIAGSTKDNWIKIGKGDAGDFWSNSSLQHSNLPTLGGILCWGKSSKYVGHVAVVERIIDDHTCVISHSDYGKSSPNGFKVSTVKVYQGIQTSGIGGNMPYLGCLMNPAVPVGAVGGPVNYSASDIIINNITPLTKIDINNRGNGGKQYDYSEKEVSREVTKDYLETIDPSEVTIAEEAPSLLSFPSLVESPFIILKVGDYTFGNFSKDLFSSDAIRDIHVDYPNYIQGMNVVKTNGTVNQYIINLIYQIEAGQDPNLLDKIFSSVGYGTIKISYGDWAMPNFIYKEEEALITKLTSKIDFSKSQINYVLNCTSNSLVLLSTCFNFPSRHAKPSSIIKEMISNNQYGLLDVFTGMKNKTKVDFYGLIPSDDKEVDIDSQEAMDPLSYLNYLVTYMSSLSNNINAVLKDSIYYLTIYDTTSNAELGTDFDGPFFKISKIQAPYGKKYLSSIKTYEIDIGYPGNNFVTNFSINDDNSWALLYNYSSKNDIHEYNYELDDDGQVVYNLSRSLTTSIKNFKTNENQKTWWTKMVQFPISATLEIKGLLRSAMLMSYVKVHAYFYGQKHTSSGLYIITKQEDTISANGYRTTLSLTRVAGDTDYLSTRTETIVNKIPILKEVVK